MQRLEVSGAVRPIYGSLGVKRLRMNAVTPIPPPPPPFKKCYLTYPSITSIHISKANINAKANKVGPMRNSKEPITEPRVLLQLLFRAALKRTV